MRFFVFLLRLAVVTAIFGVGYVFCFIASIIQPYSF